MTRTTATTPPITARAARGLVSERVLMSPVSHSGRAGGTGIARPGPRARPGLPERSVQSGGCVDQRVVGRPPDQAGVDRGVVGEVQVLRPEDPVDLHPA